MHHECPFGIAHHIGRGCFGGFASHAVLFVHRREFVLFSVAVDAKFAAFHFHLAGDEVVLGGDADPLAGCHAEPTRQRTGEPCEAHHTRAHSAAGEPDDQQNVRHQPVGHAEHRSAGQPTGYFAVARVRFGLAWNAVPTHEPTLAAR